MEKSCKYRIIHPFPTPFRLGRGRLFISPIMNEDQVMKGHNSILLCPAGWEQAACLLEASGTSVVRNQVKTAQLGSARAQGFPLISLAVEHSRLAWLLLPVITACGRQVRASAIRGRKRDALNTAEQNSNASANIFLYQREYS